MKTEQIEQWIIDRNIHTQDSRVHMCKVTEEVGELARAIIRQDNTSIKDSIGDIFITLVGISMQNNLDIVECIDYAYNEIKDRKGHLIDGLFVKEDDVTINK